MHQFGSICQPLRGRCPVGEGDGSDFRWYGRRARTGIRQLVGRCRGAGIGGQGVGLATGLQSKFDFAGVAAAGIGAGVGDFVGGRLVGKLGQAIGSFGRDLTANTAGVIANAATRSALKGNSFGDNLMAALPDIIGQTLGSAVARGGAALTRAIGESANAAPPASDPPTVGQQAEIVVIGNYSLADLRAPWHGSFSDVLRREALIEQRARHIIGEDSPDQLRLASSHALAGGDGMWWTVALPGITSEATALGGKLTGYFDAHSDKASFLAGLHGNGYIGSHIRPGTTVTTNEWAAYKIVSDVGLWRATREYLPTLNRLATQDSDAAVVRDIVAAQGAAANSRADAVDRDFGNFGRIGLTSVSGTAALIDMGVQFYNGDINAGDIMREGMVGIGAMLITRGRMSSGAAESAPLSRLGPSLHVTNGDLVQSIGMRADRIGALRMGLGNGPVAGTAKHVVADKMLSRYQRMFGDRGLSTEVRYVNNAPWREGDPLLGSIRLDVIEGPRISPTQVWDYKFGNATLSQSRIQQIRTGTNSPNLPVWGIKP